MSDCKILQGKEADRMGKIPFGKRHVIMQARAQRCMAERKRRR